MTTATSPGRLFAGRTAAERRAQRRVQLIAAAAEMYGECGYHNVTVKAVCDAAGLTERYFYESFANSEDLLCACFQEGAESLLERVSAAGQACDGPPLSKARAGLLAYLEQLRERPAASRLYLIEMSSVSARTDELVFKNLDRFGSLLVTFLRGDPRAPVSPLLVRGAIGGGLHVAQAWISDGYAEPIEEVANIILRLYALVA